jgi:predicted acetyltransferase
VTAEFDVRPVEGDDFEQYFDVRSQSFGVSRTDHDSWVELIEATPEVVSFGAYRGSRLLGALRVIPAGQFVQGRSVPMGGIAGVVVRPEARSIGVARTLLGEAITWMRDSGIAVSSLHPASTRAYRSAGWEIAGRAGWLRTPTRSFGSVRGDAAGALEPLDPTGTPEVRACYDAYAPSVPGAVDRSHPFWVLHERGGREDGAFLYGIRTEDVLTGYIAYTQTSDPNSWHYDLRIDDLVAHDRASAVALLRFVGGHSMQVREVQLPIGALPAISLLLDEQDASVHLENHWMHRIVDVPGAVAARGFPVGVAGRVTVLVTDPLTPGAGSAWRISVEEGVGSATPADDARVEVTLDIGALSALAIGGTTTGLLRNAGRLAGDDGAVACLGGLFQTPTPVITDDF